MAQDDSGRMQEKLLGDLPLLARLPRDDRQALASRARLRSYQAGATIVSEGEAGDSLHVIVEGMVRISLTSGSGDEATVAVVGPGDCFGSSRCWTGSRGRPRRSRLWQRRRSW